MVFIKSNRRYKLRFSRVYNVRREQQINHALHFVFTLLTFGLWGIIWWRLVLKSQGDNESLFSGFDDDYWSYLIEREQPPASLYRQHFSSALSSEQFEA